MTNAVGEFLAVYANTLAQVFAHVSILPGSSFATLGSRSPHIVVASNTPILYHEWGAPEDVPFKIAPRVPHPEGLVLADDYCPVDRLLSGVIREKLRW